MVITEFDRFIISDFVLMKFKGSYWDVPAEFSSKIFLEGGVFVNE